MKILHVADLHANPEWFDWVANRCVDFDLLVIAGDLQNAFSRVSMHDQARAISKWLLSIRSPTIACSGNHDYWVTDPRVTRDVFAEAGWLRMLRGRGNVVGVDQTTVAIGDFRIAVNGWSKVPDIDAADVIVTHAPPAGCACAANANGLDVGDPDLWPALQYTPPQLVLCGHIHEPRKYACTWPPIDPTSMVLVPGCDDAASMPNHWVIDTASKTATHSGGDRVGWE